MMKARTSLWASLAIAASVGLAGCGGSSNNDGPNDPPATITDTDTLPKGANLSLTDNERKETLAKDGTDKFDDGTVITCEGPGACELTYKQNAAGDYSVHSTGGTIEVTAAAPRKPLDLPDGNNIRDRLQQDDEEQTENFADGKYIDVEPGKSEDFGGVRFTCRGTVKCRVFFKTGQNTTSLEAETGGHGNGAATVVGLLSTDAVGTGVGLRTLRDEITASPTPSPSGLSQRLGFPEANTPKGDTKAFVSRHLKDPSPPGFAKEASHVAAAAPNTWKGGPWEGEAWKGGRELLVRFDNQAPAMSFAKKHGDKVGSGNDVTPVDTDTDPEDFWNLVRSVVPLAPGRKGEVAISRSSEANADPYSIAATFDGVPGTLTCPAGTNGSCKDTDSLTAENLKLDGDATTGWIFTASDPSDLVTGLGNREDFLAFGWWRRDHSAGGRFDAFEPVYGGRIPFPTGRTPANDGFESTTQQNLNGKATYEGGAAGNYTDYSGRGAPDKEDRTLTEEQPDRHGGWFRADAKLTAHFGHADTPNDPTDDNRILGTISNFMGQHGELGNGEWEVKLNNLGSNLNANQGSFAPTSPTVGNSVGGEADGEAWTGNWGANFYGETKEDDNTNTQAFRDRLPSGVAGWFHAATMTDEPGTPIVEGPAKPFVAVQGAFAATRQP